MEIPFCGGAYTGYSTNINAQRCVNLFPVIDQQEAKNAVSLYGTPGLTEIASLKTGGEVRGVYTFGRFIYAVVDSSVYSLWFGAGSFQLFLMIV